MSRSISLYSSEITIAASGTATFPPTDWPQAKRDLFHDCELHRISIAGTGALNVTATPRTEGGADASNDDTIVSGATVGYDTYPYSGANSFTLDESGGVNSVTVVIKSYKVA